MVLGIVLGRSYVILAADNAWQKETRLGQFLPWLDPWNQPVLSVALKWPLHTQDLSNAMAASAEVAGPGSS